MRAALALSSLALCGLLYGAALAGAEPAQPAAAQRAAPEPTCRDQIEDLCSDTTPNTPARRACVRQNVDKLSASCQQRLGRGRAGAKPPGARGAGGLRGFLEACAKDHERMAELCPQGQARGAPIMPCLKQHKSEFSEPCQKMIERADEGASAKQAGAGAAGAAKAAAPPPSPSQ